MDDLQGRRGGLGGRRSSALIGWTLPLWLGCGAAAPAPSAPQPSEQAMSPAATPDLPRCPPSPERDAATPPRPELLAAVAAPGRWGEDRARDADRKPAELMHFFGIAAGQHVAELMVGRGYFAELLARAVGPGGKVYAQNNRFVLNKFAEAPWSERLQRPGLEAIVRLDRELEDPGLPAGALDAVVMVLFYHDTVWMGADRAKMLAAVRAALKPGGVFGVVDHHARPGDGVAVVQTLHRIEREVVVREVVAAGFILDGESELLRHGDDDRSRNVFDPALRGRTDQFVLRFRRPR